MTQWRYIAERLNGNGTGTLLDMSVPLTDVEITDVLSGPNSFNAKIAPEYQRLRDQNGKPIFREWSTALYAEKDGQIMGGGILTNSTFEGSSWSLECTGFAGYPKDMAYTGEAHFVKTDTLDIFRHIWYHLQSQPGGNIGMTIDTRKSGVKVGSTLESEEYDPEGGEGGLTLESQAYKLAWYQDFDLSSNLDGLAADSPFDYRERHAWANEPDGTQRIRHFLDFGVPRLSKRRNDLRLVYGENIFTAPSITRDGSQMASTVNYLGSGEGSAMVRGQAHRQTGSLRRAITISDASLRNQYQVDAAAKAEIQWRQSLGDVESVTVRDSPNAPISAIDVGDEIYLSGDTGWVNLDAWFRVLSKSIRPDLNDYAELSLARTDKLA